MAAEIETHELSNLARDLYEAALEPSRWAGAAHRIALTMNSTSAVLKTFGSGERLDLVETTDNLKVAPKDLAWAEYWHRNDLWVEGSQKVGLGRVVVGHRLIAPAELEETGFYRDWLRQLDIYHMVGSVFSLGDGGVGVLGVHRDRDAPAYEDADERGVAFLMPHVQLALRIRERLSPLASTASLAALERFAAAVLVVGARRQLLYANTAADRLLTDESALRIAGGRLIARDPPADARLAQVIAQALDTAAGRIRAAGPMLQIPRTGRTPLTAMISPLPPQAMAGVGEPAALLLLRDPEANGPAPEILRHLFGLTHAEAQVAAALSQGKDLERIAAELHVGLATVRSHLKKVMMKTQTTRQAQLVALVLRSVGDLARTAPPSPK